MYSEGLEPATLEFNDIVARSSATRGVQNRNNFICRGLWISVAVDKLINFNTRLLVMSLEFPRAISFKLKDSVNSGYAGEGTSRKEMEERRDRLGSFWYNWPRQIYDA